MKRNKRSLKSFYKGILFFALISGTAINCSSQDKITISYIGNMGVLIGNDKQSVLIDGLHKEYGPQYLFPSDSLVNKIIGGKYEGFGTIDITVATHRHKDHFDPDYFYDFLDFNKSSIVILSPQTQKLLSTKITRHEEGLQQQIKITHYDSRAHTFHHNGIRIAAFQCDHANPTRHGSIENTAFVINLNGISALHVGDTNWDAAEKHLKTHQELLHRLDVAILPYWMLLEKQSIELIKQLINPAKIIATHLPPDFDETHKKSISDKFRDVEFFTKIGQELEIFAIR